MLVTVFLKSQRIIEESCHTSVDDGDLANKKGDCTTRAEKEATLIIKTWRNPGNKSPCRRYSAFRNNFQNLTEETTFKGTKRKECWGMENRMMAPSWTEKG